VGEATHSGSASLKNNSRLIGYRTHKRSFFRDLQRVSKKQQKKSQQKDEKGGQREKKRKKDSYILLCPSREKERKRRGRETGETSCKNRKRYCKRRKIRKSAFEDQYNIVEELRKGETPD